MRKRAITPHQVTILRAVATGYDTIGALWSVASNESILALRELGLIEIRDSPACNVISAAVVLTEAGKRAAS